MGLLDADGLGDLGADGECGDSRKSHQIFIIIIQNLALFKTDFHELMSLK